MTLEEFVEKNIGKKIDFDNYGGFQCVDLVRQYWKDVEEIKEHTGICASSGGAKDLYLDYAKMPLEQKYFYKIPKSKGACVGDVVFWDKTTTNKYGHTAIYLGKLNNKIIVFEQDGLKQDGAKINIRSREFLLGYLRRK